MAANNTLKIEAQKRRIRIMEEKRERMATRIGVLESKIVKAKDKLKMLQMFEDL